MSLLLILLSQLRHASGLPTDKPWQPPLHNITALQKEYAPVWVAPPMYRGTWDIIWSCTITLALCVYTAVHPNIPRKEELYYITFFRKIKWMLITLLSPEIVLYSAWLQFCSAKSAIRRLNDISKQQRLPQTYDIMLGYYICMGGFIAPCRHRGRQDDCRKDYIGGDGLIPDPSGTLYGTLTIDEVVDMAKRGYHLPFDPATIKDKSNARPIAKMMVCLEVLWMVTVSTTRYIRSYPISTLEAHTFVHVVFALAMYGLWWYKPMDVDQATKITDHRTLRLLANILTPQSREEKRERTSLIKRACNFQSILTQRDDVDPWGKHISLVFVPLTYGCLVTVSLLYSGIHYWPWKFIFPTEIERTLWIYACCATAISSLISPGYHMWAEHVFAEGFGWGTFETFFRVIKLCFFAGENVEVTTYKVLHSVAATLAVLTAPIIFAARLYLLAESFASLRQMPAGVYATVQWLEYIPHFFRN